MSDNTAMRVADLTHNTATQFELRPDSAATVALARELGLIALRKLRFAGQIAAQGEKDWVLSARLGATVVQPCVVTLEPVTTRIDVDVRRTFLAELPKADSDAESDEIRMHDDDSIEPLGAVIDPGAVMAEALALALPLYPRKHGADLDETAFTEPGRAPLRDEDVKPFAALAGLRDSLKKPR